MKLIKRDYLDKLINVIGVPDIKVVTGVRRSGKSKLLSQLADHVQEQFTDYNIIAIDLNLRIFRELQTDSKLYDYISEHYQPGKHNFLFIDEVQLCDGFEQVINSLHAEEKYDIFLTGSNAFLLSSDLATLFTGRTYQIEVFPFSLKEYMKYYELEDTNRALDQYILEGGMSGSYLYRSLEDKYQYIGEVYEALIERDIQQRHKIQNLTLINNLSDFLMDNISNLTSSRNVTNILKSAGHETNDKTVGAYIKYLCDAFAFYKVKRYDVQGKQYLATQDKYYLSDHTFKFARIGTKNMNYGRILENIVAIELLRRGYELYVGELYQKEIDFVAIKRNEKLYIQVADDVSRDETVIREVSPFLEIRDAYPKMVLARTGHDTYTYDGVEIRDLADWLVGGN